MIVVENLQKIYGANVALDLEKLELNQGETIGLIGNNGAGKTTFFRLMLDLIKANNGKVLSKDKNVKKSEHWKNYTSAHLDENFLIDFLTPREYFSFIAGLRKVEKNDLNIFLEKYEEFLGSEILVQKKYIREFSKGNKQKIGIIAALIGLPEIIILDEPFANLDPTSQFRLKNILKEIGDETLLIISSHDLNHITEICTRIVVLEKGKLVYDIERSEDTLEKLKEHFAVEA
ncbi:MAG: ABC transporter ATP-binding protein [Rhodothermaceae bacterium]